MPRNHMIFWGGREEKCGDPCEADTVVNSLFRSAALVNGVHAPGGRSAVVRNCKRRARAGARRGILIDGCINRWGEASFRKAAPTKEPELISAVADGLAALSVGSAASPGGVSVGLDTGPESGALPCNHDCKPPDPNLPAARRKQQRRRRNFRAKRRERVAPVETATLEKKEEEEEWELENEESTKTNLEKTPGPNSYVGGRPQAALSMVSPTMKALVDAVWAVWSIGASVYDYIHTSAMEERIHALEDVITIHQCVIGLLSACVLVLFTYVLLKKL